MTMTTGPDDLTRPDAIQFEDDVGLFDRDWTEDDWRRLLDHLIAVGLVRVSDVTALVLGHLNPSQVGTSLASSIGFKRNYGKGNVMRMVREWFYRENGTCKDCGARLELQA